MDDIEEINDKDSGIILHSGHDTSLNLTKDVSTHTRAVKMKQQSLQDKLELCILELKKLCIREAELTGHLCSNYPLLPGEKPPQIYKRIGAAFKLDEHCILHKEKDSELCTVEAKLALQQQIYVAAHRLCNEEYLSKAIKKSRMQQCNREKQKLQELQELVFQLRLEHSRSSPRPILIPQKDHDTSDNSSLSDSTVLDEEELTSHSSQASSKPSSITELHSVAPSPSRLPPSPFGSLLHPLEPNLSVLQPSLEYLQACHNPSVEYDPAPIQNSPWKESSLDQPYQKQKKSHSSSTCSRTPSRVLPNNAEQNRDRSQGPKRRVADVILATGDYCPITWSMENPQHQSTSKDNNSEHLSAPSYSSSPYQELLADPEQLSQAQPRYHYSHHISLSNVTHSYYKKSSAQFCPRIYRGYTDEGQGHEMNLSRNSPCTDDYYEYWYKGAPLYQQGGRLSPRHLKLSRSPSLRAYPHHPSIALPQQAISDELKSWHWRCQLQPSSPDRHCPVHIRNLPVRVSPLAHQHDYYDEVSQKPPNRTSVKKN